VDVTGTQIVKLTIKNAISVANNVVKTVVMAMVLITIAIAIALIIKIATAHSAMVQIPILIVITMNKYARLVKPERINARLPNGILI